jgi:ABC-2 type transport system ATP-binding protein
VIPAIKIRDLSWRAGKEFAIRDLSMTVPSGAIYGFLGPNGAGKTTTIRLMLGMQPAASGSIEVLGHSVPRMTHRALAEVGYVPERLHLYQAFTVAESIRFRRAFYPSFDVGHAERLRARFGLRPDQLISKLSKGESGKLMMLLALAQRAKLLVLDEPTDGLDPVLRRELLASIVEHVRATGTTVFVSSHLVHEQERICDWIGVMDQGRLIAELPMQDFRNGIKRLRLGVNDGRAASARVANAPFALLARTPLDDSTEEWVVRGWQPAMREWFDPTSGALREVIDLDLEESFVAVLSGARSTTTEVH